MAMISYSKVDTIHLDSFLNSHLVIIGAVSESFVRVLFPERCKKSYQKCMGAAHNAPKLNSGIIMIIATPDIKLSNSFRHESTADKNLNILV